MTVLGGVLQVLGILFVFAELAVMRSKEFAVPPPWAPLAERLRELLPLPQVAGVGEPLTVQRAFGERQRVRPAELPDDASEMRRIARLERYVERVDRDLDDLRDAIDADANEAIAEAGRADEKLLREIDLRKRQRHDELRWSVIRQVAGATCLLVGTLLVAVGASG